MNQTTPAEIRLDVAKSVLTITWADGHVSTYGGYYLRHICPCADCRGHSPGEKQPPGWAAVKDVTVSGARAVGTYALGFTFSDGHGTGIYSFAWLREQCPSNREDTDALGVPIAHG